MKNQIIKLLGLLLLIGCNNIEYKPKYKDFSNAWERENLMGKVKVLEQYKANVIDFKTGKTEKPIIEFKKEFTKTGNISYQEHFDNFGKIEQYIKNEFDNKGYRIKSVSENYIMNSKSIETAEFDTLINKQISANVIYNDSIDFNAFFKYDKNGNLTEQLSIQNGDTTANRFVYKYNDIGLILLKKQIQNSDFGINEYINEFKYDQNANLIELSTKSDFWKSKYSYKYDRENRIKHLKQCEEGQITEETKFDNYYNKICVKYFQNGTLNREMLFDYDFDRKGNWIEKKVSVRNSRDNKKVHAYTETRKIKYY